MKGVFSNGKAIRAIAVQLTIALTSAWIVPADALSFEKDIKIPSNFDLVEKVSEQAAGQIVSYLADYDPGSAVRLVKSKGASEADFLLEKAFLEKLREQGYRVCIASSQTPCADSSALSISYQIVRLSIRYPKISRRFLIGSKKVSREARADVIAQLTDLSTGDLIWVREGNAQYEDVIPYSMLSVVEEKQYEFTRPPREEFKVSRIVEPVVVAGIVVGLVFLFFSNQNNE